VPARGDLVSAHGGHGHGVAVDHDGQGGAAPLVEPCRAAR
jgi:hypothetical protein